MALAGSPGVGTSPSGQLQTSYNYISEYDYATQYKPELVMKLHPRYGNGLITGFCSITGSEKNYESDKVTHSEQGRLSQISTNVAVLGDVFTAPEAHNLRVGDSIIISDGLIEKQADVTAVASTVEFTAVNREAGAYGFTGNVNLFAFSSDFAKGSDGFQAGRTWSPEFYHNHTQIIKEYFDVAESDVAHASWVETAQGDRWYSYDMERTRILMQNKIEMTQVFAKRAEAGSAALAAGKGGMEGIVPTIKSRGNVGNGYITSLADIDEITFRLKQQGAGNVYTVWCDQIQLNYFSIMLAQVNAGFSGGANYGVFQNSKDMAMYLDFQSFVRNGVTFHLTPWKLLDDPTLLGGTGFIDTSLACLFVPAGEKMVTENGTTEAKPYISIRSRVGGGADRKLKTKIFGLFGTETRADKMQVEHIAEQTNQVVGANEWLVVNR